MNVNFGELSNPQLDTLILCPIAGVLSQSSTPMILIDFSNSAMQNIFPSFEEYSTSVPESSAVRQTTFPKHRVQDSLGGQTVFWHLGHSGMTNLPFFNSDSKTLMVQVSKPLRMLQPQTCFVRGPPLGAPSVFFLIFPVVVLRFRKPGQCLLPQVGGLRQSVLRGG